METFRQAAARTFEDQTVEHLKNFAPKHYEVLGEAGMREVVRLGVERAGKYGFTDRRAVRFHVELMFLFGSFFDTDLQFPWAASILRDTTVDQLQRADLLHQETMKYLDQVAGPGNEYAIEALRRARAGLSKSWPPSSTGLEEVLARQMEITYPQKCQRLGEKTLAAAIRSGLESAQGHSVTSVDGRVLFVTLALTLGLGFAADPLFPWIHKTLNNTGIADPNQRAERLRSKALTYADRVLANLGSV
jgi:hypothetical protein